MAFIRFDRSKKQSITDKAFIAQQLFMFGVGSLITKAIISSYGLTHTVNNVTFALIIVVMAGAVLLTLSDSRDKKDKK